MHFTFGILYVSLEFFLRVWLVLFGDVLEIKAYFVGSSILHILGTGAIALLCTCQSFLWPKQDDKTLQDRTAWFASFWNGII